MARTRAASLTVIPLSLAFFLGRGMLQRKSVNEPYIGRTFGSGEEILALQAVIYIRDCAGYVITYVNEDNLILLKDTIGQTRLCVYLRERRLYAAAGIGNRLRLPFSSRHDSRKQGSDYGNIYII